MAHRTPQEQQERTERLIYMARIRTIKPEFFTSEDIVRLSPLARIFYIGLWCEADREGKLPWKPFTLKLRYLPADQVDINDIAGELINSGLLFTYEVNNDSYALIPKFLKHQVINMKEAQSKIPYPNSHEFTGIHMNSPEFTEKTTGKGKERKGIGKEGSKNAREENLSDSDVVDVLRNLTEDLLTDEQKDKRFGAISRELKNSNSWHENVAIALGKTPDEIRYLIPTFLNVIKADSEYFKPLKNIQGHFRNWASRQANKQQMKPVNSTTQAIELNESIQRELEVEYQNNLHNEY